MLEIINGFLSSATFTVAVYSFGVIVLKNNKKENKKIFNTIILILSVIIHTTIFLLLDGPIKTILLCLLFMITFKLLFNTGYAKSLLASIIYAMISFVLDLALLGVVTKILNMSKDYCYNTFAGSFIGKICISLALIIILIVLKKPLRKLFNYNISTNKKILLVSSLTLISIAIFFYNLIKTFEYSDNITGYIIVLITLIIILLYLFKQKIENEAILKKYDDLLNIMKNYENDIEEQRTIIHETRNEFMTIKSKISDKVKEKEIIKYIDSILGDKTSSNMSKYSKFKYLPSNGIRGFFYYKFNEAEKRNIKVSVNISKRIENSFLGNLETKEFKDLIRIIGVYLDNAIEASKESKDKKLGIEIYLVKKDIEIIISNTFENEINIEKIGKEKFTTKGKNHGHGLLLVKHIINNNKIFESENEIINNLYVQKLLIKNSVVNN